MVKPFQIPLTLLMLGGTLLLSPIFRICADPQLKTHKEVLKLMGSRFEISAVSADPQVAWEAIRAAISEINRIEHLISSWDSLSQTSRINRMAGIEPVAVDPELYQLIERAKKVSVITGGAFDISYASMDRVWFYDGRMTALPSPEAIAASVALINYRDIELNPAQTTVFLRNKGMKIGFGAIGKGYAADRAKEVMLNLGIASGVVNAGGDLVAWGKQEDERDWQVGIADPRNKEDIISWLSTSEKAVVTSGNYEKFVELEGKTYGHIIDPRTGWPVGGLKSVTIICPSGELADALATSVFILGENDGLALINKMKGIECILVTADDELITSDHLMLNYETE
ncbi:MAG TPA: FAD:protein FMN transferase [Calditrichia bacterium]|nr:FAD:protein FMN transferase [Calditrichia bacterium]HQV33776.1 FAD:protein FMN transferase [Calditrichia bacterium]